MAAQFDLTGQRIAITGAGGGIGSATARLVAEMGADVMLSDIDAPQPLADYIASKGREATAAALDVTDRKAVEDWAAQCGAVTSLIDCAAICPFDDWEEDDWDAVAAKVFNVNLHGPLNLTRVFMNGMTERGNGGRIALVGSIAGRMGGTAAARITLWQRAVSIVSCAGYPGVGPPITFLSTLLRRHLWQHR